VVDAVRRWQFEPARENGRPVAGVIVLHFKYTNP
jgi:outer membrane biosynthesis protein TonB